MHGSIEGLAGACRVTIYVIGAHEDKANLWRSLDFLLLNTKSDAGGHRCGPRDRAGLA